MRQDVYTGLGWDALVANLDDITHSAYSVSLFTRWADAGIEQVWRKSRVDEAPAELHGARPATRTMHMLEGARHGVRHRAGRRHGSVARPAAALPDGVHAEPR